MIIAKSARPPHLSPSPPPLLSASAEAPFFISFSHDSRLDFFFCWIHENGWHLFIIFIPFPSLTRRPLFLSFFFVIMIKEFFNVSKISFLQRQHSLSLFSRTFDIELYKNLCAPRYSFYNSLCEWLTHLQSSASIDYSNNERGGEGPLWWELMTLGCVTNKCQTSILTCTCIK